MSKQPKTKKKVIKRKAGKNLNAHQLASAQRIARLSYSWRQVSYEESASGGAIGKESHGLGMLMPSTAGKTKLAFQLAMKHPRKWQVIVVLFLNKEDEESCSWVWVTSERPLVAANNGIAPLVNAANDTALSEMDDDEHCHARAVICAPLDDQRPIHPARLVSACASKIGLTNFDINSLNEWHEPAHTLELPMPEAVCV